MNELHRIIRMKEKEKIKEREARKSMQKYIYLRSADGKLRKFRNPNVRIDGGLKDSLLDKEIRRLQDIKRVKNREDFHKLFEKIMKDKEIKVYKDGYPDYAIENKSKLIFVEVKNPKEKLKENQREIRELFHKYGLRYFVYRGEEEIIKRILDEE